MLELLKIRDRIQGEYEDAVNTGDRDWREAEGLATALHIIDERIEEICEEYEI